METLEKVKNQTKTTTKTGQLVTGAEAVILSLIEEGVVDIFGYPGGAIMPVYDALFDYNHRLNHFLVRHEQGATHAAQGYARVSGKVGVCLATSGPGATNLITGIADAKIDSTPLLCITGQVYSHLLGSDAFQETDVIGISMPVTKWNYQITKAEEITEIMAKAFYLARSGRPGPVLIDITKDAQLEKVIFNYKKCELIRSYIAKPRLDMAKLAEASDLINRARKPYLIFGQGVLLAEAQDIIKAFIEKTGIPAACTLLGLSAISSDHPLNMGMLGMHGNYGPNIKTNQCDLLIAVGMRFDDRVTGDLNNYAKQAKIIHIEIDPTEINKNVKVDLAINADAKEALKALFPLVKPNSYPEWLKDFEEAYQVEKKKVIDHDLYPQSEELKMGEVIRIISELTNNEAILVSDVGQHQMVANRYYNFSQPRSSVTSGGLGTMGFALPASIGAKLAKPERQVVAVIGDGGFQMTIQEMATIAQYKIPIKIVILNNQYLGMVRQWQQLFFNKRYSSTPMVNPEFTLVAKGFGIASAKVTKREDLVKSIKTMVESPTAFLVEVVVEKEDNIFPMIAPGESVSDIRLE
ncbi:MAG: biosynthetic-type acetolactate synthase large subunit [Bacteroidetes bacterium]|nr:biosynthetic-type acetolactate synthase large subunit [Bacteroidota bacterium]